MSAFSIPYKAQLENLRRGLYIAIDLEANGIGFDKYLINKASKSKKFYASLNKNYGKGYLSDLKEDACNGSGKLKVYIHILFSIPFCYDKKLKQKTYSLYKQNNYIGISNLYHKLQQNTDAPMAHWGWREKFLKNSNSPRPLINEAKKELQKACKKYNYQLKEIPKGNSQILSCINLRNNKAILNIAELPQPVQKAIKKFCNVANYIDSKK